MNFVQSNLLAFLAAAACTTSTFAGNGNDTCETADVITSGTVTGSCWDECVPHTGSCWTDFDWYRITVPAGAELFVHLEVLQLTPPASPYANLYDGGLAGTCPAPLLGGVSTLLSDGLTYVWRNGASTSREVFVKVYCYLPDPEGFASMSYALSTNVYAGPCLSQSDDRFSPNHAAGDAPQDLTDGVYPSLFVRFTKPDVFNVLVPPHGSFTATATFNGALGDVDLSVYPAGPASTGTGDVETITWTNPEGVVRFVRFIAHIKLGNYDQCNTYDLAIDVQSTWGTDYCPAAFNSQGIGSSLTLGSEPFASVSSWTWWAFGMGWNAPVHLYCGNQQASIPFGDGTRCVGGSLFRLRTLTGTGFGYALIQIQAVNLPPALQFQAGATWNFQTMYRDQGGPLGTGFNLSNGVAVTFLP